MIGTRTRSHTMRVASTVVAASAVATSTLACTSRPIQPPARHVFVINLENKGFATTFGTNAAPYLSQTLRKQGVLLDQYHGTAHNSLPNYLAQISGQGPNPQQQADCQVFTPFVGTGPVAAHQQAVGDGCVYPSSVPTLAGQLRSKGRSWKGYMEDMGNDPTRESATCGRPTLGLPDGTQTATKTDSYAARHDPFVYFQSIGAADCHARVVNLRRLQTDLAATATTPNLSYITPSLCHDGHDTPCADGEPGGLTSADAFLRTWVPRIQNSPAFKKDGLLVITFDESDSPLSDATASGGEMPGPNSPLPGITGPGGGRVGAVVLSRWTRAGTTSHTGYNHYSLLASIEDVFGLPRLGFAGQAGLPRFGRDVYSS